MSSRASKALATSGKFTIKLIVLYTHADELRLSRQFRLYEVKLFWRLYKTFVFKTETALNYVNNNFVYKWRDIKRDRY